MKKSIPIVVLLVLAGVGIWQWRARFGMSDTPLTLYGNVDIRGVDLGFRVSGRLLEVLPDEGDAVQAGQPLAKIDPQPYAHELARAEAELAAAKAEQQLRESGARSEEIEQARASLEESRVFAADAERSFERQSALIRTGSTSKQNLESAQATLDQAKQRVRSNEAKLELLEAGFRAEEKAAAAARVALAKAARDSAALHLEDTELKSPAAGVVLTRAVEPGTILQAGATVFSLSLEQPVWVRAYVHEPDLGRVRPGTKVRVSSDGNPGRYFHGKVGFVSPRAEFTPKSVETPELRTSLVYRLRVVVEDSDGSLRQGMPVTVTLDSNPH